MLKECETKLAAVLAGGVGGRGRWDAAGSLISNLLETSQMEDEDLSMEMSLLRMSEFIELEAEASSTNVGPARKADAGEGKDGEHGGAKNPLRQRTSESALSPNGGMTPSPQTSAATRTEDADMVVAMVVRNMVAAVEASAS